MQQVIPKGRIPDAVSLLARKRAVFAPARRGTTFAFAPVDRPEDVVLDYPTTILPLKKYFLPPRETLLRYNRDTHESTAPGLDAGPRLFFGVHNYDAQALLRLDHAFAAGIRDESWFARRAGSLIVGVGYTPDDSHFSPSVGIPTDSREGLDAFLADAGDCWTIQAVTAAGAALVRELASLIEKRDVPAPGLPVFRTKLRQSAAGARDAFHGAYGHPVWQETARKCLSCGTCTAVCPTCYCFDVDDETDLGASTGDRVRRWDSCQSTGFAAVAGGESFRARRADRVRHRLSRKLAWNADDQGRPFCVGCGRCTRECTAGISIVDVMNALL